MPLSEHRRRARAHVAGAPRLFSAPTSRVAGMVVRLGCSRIISIILLALSLVGIGAPSSLLAARRCRTWW
jgi:hypothetical protein